MASVEETRARATGGKTHEHRSEVRDGMRIDWDVPIKMHDGLVLRADVFRPVKDGRYPVILSYGPYAKGLAFQDGYPSAWQRMAERHPDVTAGSSNLYQSWEVVDPEKWVPHDYACVRVDSRGCGCSPGFIDHSSPCETKDFYDCIEWAGVQPWSNGKVGLNGISYYGINQWHVATLQPPHLAAMCIWEGAADWYRDMTHHGGIVCTFWENWYDMQVKTVQYGAGERGKRSRVHGELVCGPRTLSEAELKNNRSALGDDIRAHPLDDAYHRARSPVWSKVKTPLLSAANWGGQPLTQEPEITGPSAVKVFVSSSTKDADIFAVLRVFGGDLKEVVFQGAIDPHTPIGQGWLRASHRKLDKRLSTPYRPYHSHDKIEPLKKGEAVELDIEIWPTSIVVQAGHRIGLTVRGKDYVYGGPSGGKLSDFKNELTGCGPFLHDDPRDRPTDGFGGVTSLHFGGGRQPRLLLPIIPATKPAAQKRGSRRD